LTDTEHVYVYDDMDIALEYVSGTLVNQFVHGSGVDEHLGIVQSGTPYYYLTDGLGSVTRITDGSGAVVQSYVYTAFGKVTATGLFVQPYSFTGREYDAETGLHYYRARYLDPDSGRFIGKDPIGFEAGDPVLYGYVGGNAVNLRDPLGLIWVTVDYNYPTGQNYLQYLWNRFYQGFDKEIKRDNFANMKREVIQEWQRDSNNPCRDKEYPIGARRIIPQNYTQYINPGSREVIINNPNENFYYQWVPWVESSTYKNYPNMKLKILYWRQGL